MRMTLVTAVAALPALVAAAPPVGRTETSIPIAKRSSLINADKTVNLDALNSHVAAVQAKILRGFANYEKNTGSPHPSAPRGVNRRDTGFTALTDYNNHLWYGEIQVGTPLATFTVDFDTGSSDLFLPGPNCGSSCQGHTIYDPNSSSTSNDLGKDFDLAYSLGDGNGSTVSGEQYTDNVAISSLVANDQTLGVASQYSSGFQISQFPADGLMGMAFPQISVYQANPFFNTLIAEGVLDQPVFGFKLSESDAELFLGGVNEALVSGDFTYVPVTQEGYWQVTMDSIAIDGNVVVGTTQSIIDTGSATITGDSHSVANIYASISGASDTGSGIYTVPCDSNVNLSLTFGGREFAIDPSTFVLGPVSSGSNTCLGGLTANDDIASQFWVVGDVFLRNVYTAFDMGNSQVGFANLA